MHAIALRIQYCLACCGIRHVSHASGMDKDGMESTYLISPGAITILDLG
jgi:hypothetical protein